MKLLDLKNASPDSKLCKTITVPVLWSGHDSLSPGCYSAVAFTSVCRIAELQYCNNLGQHLLWLSGCYLMAGGRMWQVPPCDTLQLERNKISQNCQYIQIVWLMECLIFKTGYTRYSLRLLWWCRDRAAAPRVIRSHVPRVRTGQCRRWARPGEVGKWWHVLSFMQSMQSIHGIMGSPEQIRSHKFDHPRTANIHTQPHPGCVWLAAVSPCRAPIGRLSPLPCLSTSPSCWGTHFLYLSNPHL